MNIEYCVRSREATSWSKCKFFYQNVLVSSTFIESNFPFDRQYYQGFYRWIVNSSRWGQP